MTARLPYNVDCGGAAYHIDCLGSGLGHGSHFSTTVIEGFSAEQLCKAAAKAVKSAPVTPEQVRDPAFDGTAEGSGQVGAARRAHSRPRALAREARARAGQAADVASLSGIDKTDRSGT